MKKIALIAAISLAALSVGAAFAADLPSHKAPPVYVPPPPPPPLWTGFYAGLNLGGGFYANNSSNQGWGWNNGGGGGSGGVVGGGQIGYNYQFGSSFVVGAETDFQGTSIGSGGNNNNLGWLFGFPPVTTARLNWFGTVRGRLGWLFTPTVLVYGTGGFAYGEVQRNGWLNQNSAVQTGWTAGAGAEWMFMPNWSVKAEYLYTQISGSNSNNGWLWAFNPGWGLNNVNNRTRFHTIRAGVNYHFNWGAPAPVLAKY